MKFRTLPKATLPEFSLAASMILALLLILTWLLWPPRAVPQALQPQPEVRVSQVREHMLVSTEWLARHLTDSGVVILHVARERADYDAGHLPGARFLAVGRITVTRDKVSNELAPAEELKKVFESLGVGDRTQVVLYGERQGLWAARAWFTLDYLGHGENAALLDGNIEKWRSENRPLTKDVLPIKPASFSPHVHPGVLVTLPVMRDLSWEALNTTSPTAVLVDARPPEQYRGEESVSDTPRAGRIPGALNLYWMTTLESQENPHLLSAAELRRLFQSAGIAPGRKVVSYCHSGVQGAYAYFIAKYLGYEAALYDGSFQEWSNAAGTQVAAASAQQVPAVRHIIDVHVHAYTRDERLGSRITVPTTGETLVAARDAAEHQAATFAEMKRLNVVKAVVSGGDREAELRWKQVAPEQIIIGYTIGDPTKADFALLRREHAAGRLQVIGEVGPQYEGIRPNDPRMEPLYSLAEELDVPIALHLHPGPPGAPYPPFGMTKMRAGNGHPLLLEDVLVSHPKLRLYVMHAGWPFLDEMKALLYEHPQVFVDLGVIGWSQPRPEFHRFLHGLVEAGYGKRIMFGSDQMVWPDRIEKTVEAIEQADFLTAQQKEDIFYNNAVRFLRLEPK